MPGFRRWFNVLFMGLLLAGCRSDIQPPAPTVIPTITETEHASPTPTLIQSATGSIEPTATFRPVITPTSGATTVALAINTPTLVPTLGPFCVTSVQGDSLISLL